MTTCFPCYLIIYNNLFIKNKEKEGERYKNFYNFPRFSVFHLFFFCAWQKFKQNTIQQQSWIISWLHHRIHQPNFVRRREEGFSFFYTLYIIILYTYAFNSICFFSNHNQCADSFCSSLHFYHQNVWQYLVWILIVRLYFFYYDFISFHFYYYYFSSNLLFQKPQSIFS